ncbi:MAG: 4-hydroxy-3-methylbut-2-enyl diphosphate reductase [Bacteroidales bacterium]|jgi:4-hydroxy-3-methylbut-2-enyl diphosphate reductase|nr:4-hydroxy-3-methylbut-2-enyl diphosphate reductase [Bacteroidales bacterium]
MDTATHSTAQKIEIDKKSGFCFGVIHAIKQAEQALKTTQPLYCLGDIVHNSAEVHRLESKGLRTIQYEEFKQLRNATVLLRAHGEPPSTYEIAKKNNITIIDATCPVVLQLQKKIKKRFEQCSPHKEQILIFGKEGHAEVVGLLGQTENTALVINSPLDIERIDYNKALFLYSQTTKSLHEFEQLQQKIQQKIDEHHVNIPFTSYDTICRQVANREAELKLFAQNYDMILFVSDKKSSNGHVLFNICQQVNSNTYFVSSVGDVEQLRIAPNQSIGICGATSTPKWLMEKIAQALHKNS